MIINIFTSGYPRTFFDCFGKNLERIRESVKKCEIYVYYSFWNDMTRSKEINDPWHINIGQKKEVILNQFNIDQYLIDNGADQVEGEIEDIEKMFSITNTSPFSQNGLSSQYYKILKVYEKFYKNNDGLYLRLRPDVQINSFPNNNILESILYENKIIVNKNFWYSAEYNERECNEMIWIGNNSNFGYTNKIFLSQDSLSEMIPKHHQYGEHITGYYFNDLVKKGVIKSIQKFDFDYRVLR